MAGETDARSDEMLLELLLTFAISRKDTRPLAQELIEIFGSLSQVFSASSSDLNKIKGLGQASVTLLKVANFIQSEIEPSEKKSQTDKRAIATQQNLFEESTDKQAPKHPDKDFHITKPETLSTNSEPDSEISNLIDPVAAAITSRRPSSPSKKTPPLKNIFQRKFQVSNGYLLGFDQLARILHFLLEHRDAKKINRKVLQEDTGLADRQVESLVSMGSAMGLIKPGLQILTSSGLLIAQNDLFFNKHGTLEWCHYKGAGSYQNLVWFEVFNYLLAEETATTQQGWQDYFREKLHAQYTEKTIKKHLPKEVHFVIDSYLERNFSVLELLHRLGDERLYRRRYTGFAPLILGAMIYDFCAKKETQLYQVAEMATTPGSPAMVFGLDAASFRQQIEGLHDRGWLRYETTHNLDQIRLKPGFCALEFLTAHFEDREPHQNGVSRNDE